ncbi:hypothetical protein Tco_0841891 [Tanacetum coccineum]|uniref:Uncharacterized protein n=1 Tax=Tanacetum coccineum TaxID=301880 RepID=A0ABQ5AZI5_9ASTR
MSGLVSASHHGRQSPARSPDMAAFAGGVRQHRCGTFEDSRKCLTNISYQHMGQVSHAGSWAFIAWKGKLSGEKEEEKQKKEKKKKNGKKKKEGRKKRGERRTRAKKGRGRGKEERKKKEWGNGRRKSGDEDREEEEKEYELEKRAKGEEEERREEEEGRKPILVGGDMGWNSLVECEYLSSNTWRRV